MSGCVKTTLLTLTRYGARSVARSAVWRKNLQISLCKLRTSVFFHEERW